LELGAPSTIATLMAASSLEAMVMIASSQHLGRTRKHAGRSVMTPCGTEIFNFRYV
jgi:hypothetical protein